MRGVEAANSMSLLLVTKGLTLLAYRGSAGTGPGALPLLYACRESSGGDMRNIRINTFVNTYPSVHHPNQAEGTCVTYVLTHLPMHTRVCITPIKPTSLSGQLPL